MTPITDSTYGFAATVINTICFVLNVEREE